MKLHDVRVARALLAAGAASQAIGLTIGAIGVGRQHSAVSSARLFLVAGAAAILLLAIYERDVTLFVGQLAALILALRFTGDRGGDRGGDKPGDSGRS